MFTKEDILARLQNGDSMDEIAKEMSDALNAAGAEYEEAKQADAEANRVRDAKRAAVSMMLDGLCDYLFAANEVELLKELRDVDTDEVVAALDSVVAFTKSLEALKGLEFPLVSMPKSECGHDMPKVSVKMVDPTNADMIIKSFLKGI
jgi:hypothetical protein